MRLVHRLVCVALVLGAVVPTLASCSSPVAGVAGSDGAVVASSDQAVGGWRSGGSCPAATTYFVIAPTQAGVAPACDAVPGKNGAWEYTSGTKVRPCFSNADPSETSVLCAYSWTSDAGASPDVAALSALDGVAIAPLGGGVGPSCSDMSPLPFVALLHEADVTCPPVPGGPGPNGPKGCDVCGTGLGPGVFGNHLYLSEGTSLHTVAVSLSNGTKQIVTLGDLTSRGGFIEITLPRPPRGVAYESGVALGYGYESPAH